MYLKKCGKKGKRHGKYGNNMNILLTGSDGYIGTVVSDMLLQLGHNVVGIDTGFYRRGWLFNGVTKSPRVLTQDIRSLTIDQLKGFEAVIHMAELSNDPLGQNDPDATYKMSYVGSVEFVKKCKTSGVGRFIYMSSCSVYGIAEDGIVNESSPVNPQTMYAKCKVLVEKNAQKLADDHFTPIFLRNATVYGASPRMRFDLVVNNLAGLAWTTNKIALSSDGTPWRPLVHIRDVAQAIALCLIAPKEKVHNQTFNVGSNDSNYQIKDIANVIAKVFSGCKLTFGSSDGDSRSYRVSFDKIRKHLPEFTCKWNVEKGAQELKAVFESVQLTSDMFSYQPYTRIKEILYLRDSQQIDNNFFWKNK